jgi:hypothetical protein
MPAPSSVSPSSATLLVPRPLLLDLQAAVPLSARGEPRLSRLPCVDAQGYQGLDVG